MGLGDYVKSFFTTEPNPSSLTTEPPIAPASTPVPVPSSAKIEPDPLKPPPETISPTNLPHGPQNFPDLGLSTNPGTFEDLHKNCRDLFPQMFEGCKISISKGLSSHFQVQHTLTLNTISSQPPGYKFGATYAGVNQISATEAYPVLMGEIDPSGNLNANILQTLSNRLRLKCAAQIQKSRWQSYQASLDYRAPFYTVAFTTANLNIFNNSGVGVLHYLHSITNNWVLGGEVMTQFSKGLPGNRLTMLSLAAKYIDEKWQAACSVTPGALGVHATYYQRVDPNLQIGVELEGSVTVGESIATIGYQYDIPESGFTIKGQMDTKWAIGSVVEKRMDPLPFTLILSGYANHVKANYMFGIGLQVG